MSAAEIIGLIVAIALGVYLAYALFWGEEL